MTTQELETINKAKSGDKSAINLLCTTYSKYIDNVLLSILPDQDDRNEVKQIVYIKLWQKINEFEPISFKFWLKTIITNSAIDFLRKKAIIPAMEEIDDPEYYTQYAASTKSPEEELVFNESVEKLRESLKLLRSEYRNVLELRYDKLCSYEEISAELNKPVGTIKSLLHKAKKRLFELNNKQF